MLNKRIGEIFKICEKNTTVSVPELVDIFHVSPATIRRDLQLMEDHKMIERFYGGAKINAEQKAEKSIMVNTLSHVEEKTMIARYAASLIKDRDVVYIDAGSTGNKIIDYITAKDILVVTQGVSNVVSLMNRNINCYMAGGYIKFNTGVLISNETIEKIRSLKFSISFLGANGVHPITGFTTTDDREGNLKRAVLENSIAPYIVLDSSKFGKLNFYQFCDFDAAPVITDTLLEDFDYQVFPQIISVTADGVQVLEHDIVSLKTQSN